VLSTSPLVPVQEPGILSVHGASHGVRIRLRIKLCAVHGGDLDAMPVSKWLVLVLIAVSCWAQDDQAQKPVCNSQNRGMLWPERISGHDRVPVEMCSVKSRKYQWRPLTVDFSDLLKVAKPHPSKAPSTPFVAEPSPEAEQSSAKIASEQSPR